MKLVIKHFCNFRFGTMHLVALNIIMWIRTLIKESIEEIIEFESEHRVSICTSAAKWVTCNLDSLVD